MRGRGFREEECMFFVKGWTFDDFAARGLRIPDLSHAKIEYEYSGAAPKGTAPLANCAKMEYNEE